jgi:hypothetical protein
MKKKDCLIDSKQKKEIVYNLINGFLAGFLVLLGSFSTGELTAKGIFFSVVASLIVVITKFKEYWDGEKNEYTSKVFSFVHA